MIIICIQIIFIKIFGREAQGDKISKWNMTLQVGFVNRKGTLGKNYRYLNIGWALVSVINIDTSGLRNVLY